MNGIMGENIINREQGNQKTTNKVAVLGRPTGLPVGWLDKLKLSITQSESL